ncbi:MAG: sulfite exporter TauE/SafE family protein [Gaiellaceae bacterium]
MTYALAVALGVVAGLLAGLFGVGGGILFVPVLLLLGRSQLHAEATSLLAILPTVAAGAWRQQRYGNVRWRVALVIGLGSVAGVEGGAYLAVHLPGDVLRKLFAVLLLAVAAQIAWRARRSSPYSVPMPDLDEIWVPLVDEPIGSIVEKIEREQEIARLIASPHRILAFRTFAYIRVGLLLGQLLFDHDLPPYDGSETWVHALLKDSAHHEALAREVRAVAEEIAADPTYATDEPLGPDDAARERFKAFAKERLDDS